MGTIITHQEKETDRREASRNVYGLRSLLGPGVCQHCGSPSGQIAVWDDEDPLNSNWGSFEYGSEGYTLANCPVCNAKAEAS